MPSLCPDFAWGGAANCDIAAEDLYKISRTLEMYGKTIKQLCLDYAWTLPGDGQPTAILLPRIAVRAAEPSKSKRKQLKVNDFQSRKSHCKMSRTAKK